jgi:hypothetical protein
MYRWRLAVGQVLSKKTKKTRRLDPHFYLNPLRNQTAKSTNKDGSFTRGDGPQMAVPAAPHLFLRF